MVSDDEEVVSDDDEDEDEDEGLVGGTVAGVGGASGHEGTGGEKIADPGSLGKAKSVG